MVARSKKDSGDSAKPKREEAKNAYWLTVVYPESAPEGWLDTLAERGAMAIVSPLHDSDINQGTGEIKKEHYHVCLMWPKPTTFSNAQRACQMIGGVGCISALTLRGSARYFCHLDNPEKAQYSVDDVKTFGGVDYLDIINSTTDDDLELSYLYQHIKDTGEVSFLDLVLWCNVNNRRWLHLINHKYRENVWKALRSNEYSARSQLEDRYKGEVDRLLLANEQLKTELQSAQDDRAKLRAKLDMMQ